MKCCKILLLMVLVLVATVLTAPAALAKSVTATGYGQTTAEAETDALRAAVENTLGVMVDSETITKNYAVVSDSIYTNSRGFITSYTVRSTAPSDKGYAVTIDAVVDDSPNSKLVNELTRLGIIDRVLRNPRIAVYVPEKIIGKNAPESASENAIISALTEAGFTNVIAASPRLNTAGMYLGTNVNLEQLRQAARFLTADILVYGAATSESAGDPAKFLPGTQTSGLVSCRAHVEARLYMAQTGQTIAAETASAAGLDIAEAVAAKKALTSAGAELGSTLVGKLVTVSPARQGFQVEVTAASFDGVNKVQTALSEAHGVKNVQLASYERGHAVFTLLYGGAPQTLYRALAEKVAGLQLVTTGYNTLELAL